MNNGDPLRNSRNLRSKAIGSIMAVGIIIGTAFNKVVDVLIKGIVLPPFSLMTSGINFSDKKIVLREGIASSAPGIDEIKEIAIRYGAFLETIIDFLIVGFTIFLVIKFMNKFRRKARILKIKLLKPQRYSTAF